MADRPVFTEKLVNDNAEGWLRHYIIEVFDESKDKSISGVPKSEIRAKPEFALLCSSYATLQAQKTSSKQQDRLAKQGNRLQLFLALFAAISSAGVILEALLALHILV